MKVNFYWSGQKWSFVNRLTIASHIRVGHEVVVWVNRIPNSDNLYWIDDLPLKINKAKNYVNTRDMLKNGWNLRTISTIFQYKFMLKTGEYTADCDAIALKHWPDVPMVLCPELNSKVNLVSSVGVLRVPKDHEVLKCAIEKARKDWGNVKIFSMCCRRFKLKSTYPSKYFYPVTCKKGEASKTLLEKVDIPNAFSYHVFTNNKFSKKVNHEVVERKSDSLIYKISKWAFGNDYKWIRNET